jgi:hypothetical protein
VLAIVLVVGTISIIDLRLLGIASLDRAATRLMADVLPWTWGAFVIAVITGSSLFQQRSEVRHNFFFEGKMVLLAAAGVQHGDLPPVRPSRSSRAGIRRSAHRRRLELRHRIAAALDCGRGIRPVDRLHAALNWL